MIGRMTERNNMITWVDDYVHKEFSSGGHMGEDGVAWCRVSKKWMTAFLKRLGATEIKFRKGHYEWSMFALLKGQYWYFSSGDCRFKSMVSLLVRKADSPTDYTGQGNMWVNYDVPDFEYSLERLLTLGGQQTPHGWRF